MIRWTTELRDQLIEAEISEHLGDDDDDNRDRLTRSIIALASIDVGTELTIDVDDTELDDDVPPGPNGNYVWMLLSFHRIAPYSN
jgi:hypothetical protein